MTTGFQYPTEYFLQEGKANIASCLQATFAAAIAHQVRKVIIFTSAGRGVLTALDEYCSKDQHSHIQLIAVTFPSQSQFTEGDPSEHSISDEAQRILDSKNVPGGARPFAVPSNSCPLRRPRRARAGLQLNRERFAHFRWQYELVRPSCAHGL